MAASKRCQEQELNSLLKSAIELHGHFGPFLTMGVRMGLVGLRELRTREGDTQLCVTAMLEYAVPFSCMLDGIQVSTKCTVGNKRLAWKESKKFGAVFMLKNSGQQVEVKVSPSMVQELRRKLKKKPLDGEVRQLASDIAACSDEELFLVRRK